LKVVIITYKNVIHATAYSYFYVSVSVLIVT